MHIMNNLYNTQFHVKYKEIREELLQILNQKPNDYSKEDIFDICGKLYRDEYASVFYCDNFLDDKIDESLRTLYASFSSNKEFDDCMKEMLNCVKDEEEIEQYHIFLSLFAEDLFYLMHPFVCHFLENNTINKELFTKIFHEWKFLFNLS